MLKGKAIQVIAEWEILNDKLNDLYKYAFNNTEIWEQQYMSDYKTEIFSFFAGKITRIARDRNELYKYLTTGDIKNIQFEKIKRR